MRLSKQEFEDLLCLYLDNEASQEEIDLLSDAISDDKDFYLSFKKAYHIHIATCKMYNKPVNLKPIYIQVYTDQENDVSKKLITFEWLAVASLAICSIVLFKLAQSYNTEDVPMMQEYANMFDDPDFYAVPSEQIISDNNTFSTLEFKSRRTILFINE